MRTPTEVPKSKWDVSHAMTWIRLRIPVIVNINANIHVNIHVNVQATLSGPSRYYSHVYAVLKSKR